jgi:hypothetical protein
MQDEPSAAAIVDTVATALREGLSGPFDQRVAANALALAARELRLAEAGHAAEHRRLERILGRGGALAQLNALLCARIRDGSLAIGDAALAAHLRATVAEKMTIDQPRYPAFRAVEGT